MQINLVFLGFLSQNTNVIQQNRGKSVADPKRLFLFAGFDKDNIIDDTVVYYVNALSKLGDVVFVVDNDLPKSELKKISKIPHVLYVGAGRHGEYDFGSYKRGYLWAKKILKKYDWLYFANDSVYGPLNDLKPILDKLEHSGADLVGMTANRDNYTPLHVQSWFAGFNKKVFNSTFFDSFMKKIARIPHKTSLVLKYEVGLSSLIMRHGFKMHVVVDANNNKIYEDPRYMLVSGVPFIKKTAVARLRKLYFLYPHLDDDVLLDYIVAHMRRHNVKLVKNDYRIVYELRILGVPLLRMLAKDEKYYKLYLFNFIPLVKYVKHG